MKNIDILRDIANIVKDDRDHNVEVKVNPDGLTIYLEYDPERNCREQCVIPVQFDIFDEVTCIPQDELIEKFRVNEGGIDLDEIELIREIMRYLEANKDEIKQLCALYDLADRHIK